MATALLAAGSLPRLWDAPPAQGLVATSTEGRRAWPHPCPSPTAGSCWGGRPAGVAARGDIGVRSFCLRGRSGRGPGRGVRAHSQVEFAPLAAPVLSPPPRISEAGRGVPIRSPSPYSFL